MRERIINGVLKKLAMPIAMGVRGAKQVSEVGAKFNFSVVM